MNNKSVIALGAVCALLVLVIFGELIYAQFAQQLLGESPAAEKKPAQDEMPGVDLTRRSEDSFDDMVARPLFVEGRKPVIEPAPGQTQTTAVNVKFDWQLNGVFTSHGQLIALVARVAAKVPKDNYRKLKLGDDLDGWKLTIIKPDQIILSQDGTEKPLQLRKPKLKQLAQKKPNLPPHRTQPGEETPEGGKPEDGQQLPTPELENEPGFEPESTDESFENNDNEQF